MIIEEHTSLTSRNNQDPGVEQNAYEEMQESNDMAKRGYRDRIKFSHKRSRKDAEDFDVEMTDAYPETKPPPPKKKNVRFDGRKKARRGRV